MRHLGDDDEIVGIDVVRQQFTTALRYQHHVLVLHTESEAGLVYEGLDPEHHAGFERLIVSRSEIRVFVQVQADAVTDERNWRQRKLAEFAEIKLIDRAARSAGLDRLEQQIFASG